MNLSHNLASYIDVQWDPPRGRKVQEFSSAAVAHDSAGAPHIELSKSLFVSDASIISLTRWSSSGISFAHFVQVP